LSSQPTNAGAGRAPKKRAPTLYAISAIKLGKGLLLLFLAFGVYTLADDNLPQEFQSMLRILRLDPERHFFANFTQSLGQITPENVRVVAGGTVLYSLFSLVEGTGLVFRVGWAGWMAIGESAFFVPVEIYELLHKYSITVGIILALNILIVWYLFQNRKRLFHRA